MIDVGSRARIFQCLGARHYVDGKGERSLDRY